MTIIKKQIGTILLIVVFGVCSPWNSFGQYKDLTLTGDDIVSLKMITQTPNANGIATEFRLNQKMAYGNNFIGFADKNNTFLNYTNSFGDFYVRNKIKVGMRGSWPHAKLGFDTTWNDDFVIGILDFSNNFYGFGYRMNTRISSGELRVQSGTNGDVTFGRRTGSEDGDFVENIRFVSNGNVGIGTNHPAYKLDINGEINATGFKLNGVPFPGLGSSQWTTSNTTINYALGNVGIDNTSPTAKLEIGTNNTASLPTVTPNDVLLKVHGSATFDDNNDNALTQVSINTEYKLDGSTLTVGGPTFIGSWDETKIIASAPIVKTDYLNKYNLWVTKGVVSEDFAITGKDSWRDDVFKEGYKLPTLSEVETFVKQNKHLPGVPSEKEVQEKGYTVHQMNNAFLEKIEHLVLYSIDQEKKLKEQAKQLKEQTVLNEEFKAKLDILQAKLETLSNKK